MADALGSAFDAAVAEIARVFEHYLDRLGELAAEVVAASAEGDGLAEEQLKPVRRRIEDWLTEDGVCVGYGFVAAPGVVDDLERFMLWFQGQGPELRRLQLFGDSSFDITAEGRKPHFGFGGGAHHCLGHFVARSDMSEALPLLARRMPNVRPDGPGTWMPDSGNTGPLTLPVVFDA